MTLKRLMSLFSDDTWFRFEDNRKRVREFYNADFIVRDKGVMEILRPFLNKKVKKAEIENMKNPLLSFGRRRMFPAVFVELDFGK